MSSLENIGKVFEVVLNGTPHVKVISAVCYHMISNGVSSVKSDNNLGMVAMPSDTFITMERKMIDAGWTVYRKEVVGDDRGGDVIGIEAFNHDGSIIYGYISIRYFVTSETMRIVTLANSDLSDWVRNIVTEFESYKLPSPVEIDILVGYSSTTSRPTLKSRHIAMDDNPPVDVFYPFIENGIDQLAGGYLTSSSNLLLLMGIPGSGKTTLMRELCRRYHTRPLFQVSGSKLVDDPNFDSFIGDLRDGSIVIIEDADTLLLSRKSGNQSMSMLLNELDGIATRDLKFIMTTNLSNVNDIDDAIYRTGRCYDVINFRKLTVDEIKKIGEVCELDVSHITSRSNLADVFSKKPIHEGDVKNSAGFISN